LETVALHVSISLALPIAKLPATTLIVDGIDSRWHRLQRSFLSFMNFALCFQLSCFYNGPKS